MLDSGLLAAQLRASLDQQQQELRSSLVLNPVENFPFPDDVAVAAGTLHGLYTSDKVRTREQRVETVMQFAGRQALERDLQAIYTTWADALSAADVTLRVLSGLHAHIVLFMAMARPGESVLLLPVEAGGHVSGKAILERLGLHVFEMSVDIANTCVDVDQTLAGLEIRPDYVFVDRSEGLVFEDFSWLEGIARVGSVFDSSQYLTNIICGDHPNPFDWGFDLAVASIHKNFPGPQKALLATRERDDAWSRILSGTSTFVSNMHAASTYSAGLTLSRTAWLAEYSRGMLDRAVELEDALAGHGVPVIRRRRDLPPTHHVWIREPTKERAFQSYERLERCRILTNFRKLPYGLGYGLRIGLSAAVRIGLGADDVSELAALIAGIRDGDDARLERRAAAFNASVWERGELA